jgi:ABC-type transport system involved in cytochrome c biogenesis ATPase subunit
MRIKEISISRLFGLFNHDIPMKMSDRVTIITSPNGYGKTTILRLVDNLIAGRYADIRRTPFRDLRITFENGIVLQVVRVDAPRPSNRPQSADLIVSLQGGGRKEQTTLSAPPRDALGVPVSMIERAIPHLARIGPSLWRDKKSGREMDIEELFRTYSHFFPVADSKLSSFAEPPWLSEFRNSVKVKFIEVQRLLRVARGFEGGDDEPWRPSVVIYSADLASLIKAKLAEYATLSQSLDRSFPKRLVDKTNAPNKPKVSVNQLRDRLQQLEDKRIALTSAGLLDKEDERFDLPGLLTNPTLTDSVLPVYAEDAEQKLRVFDDIAAKIEMLTSIVRNHFQFKVLSIDKEKGFQFYTDYPGDSHKPLPLPTARLSSGEQHMLVLLYELLFTVASGSLVMIDEPETSLHVTWQLEFLKDIQRITELTGIDALIATHAPGIISNRLDLKVDLEAPDREAR